MGGERLIWIVDDDEEMNQAVRLMLELLEFRVQTFVDAPSASRELLTGERPDAIVLDIAMPEVSGIDMLEFLRRRKDLSQIPVVMLSTETTDVQVDEAMALGADAFVFKPVTIEELEKAIENAIAKHQSAQAGDHL
ncbi:MAG: response regulator [Anaerolineales bacterium]|jgi:DNA-binding response OmpR family regulator